MNKFLISSEHLYSRLREENEVSNLYNMVNEIFDEVRIIFWSREQVSLLKSSYSTSLRSGDDQTYDEYFATNFYYENPYLNFEKGLALWEQNFGRSAISLHMYEEAKLHSNGLPAFFFQSIGIDVSDLPAPQSKNTGLNGLQAKILCELNKRYIFDHSDFLEIIEFIESLDVPDISFSAIEESTIDLSLFKQSNERLFQNYCEGHQPKFSQEVLRHPKLKIVNYEELFFGVVVALALRPKMEKTIGALKNPLRFYF